jgi:predicted amidophosphoribosyltransferase
VGLRLGDGDNYPPGVDNSHPHFWQDGAIDHCPDCGAPIFDGDDEVYCQHCGFPLDEDEAAALEEAE